MLRSCIRLMALPKPRHENIVAVIGTTGVGKSQLAVSLAQTLQRSGTCPEPHEVRSGSQEGKSGQRYASYNNGVVLSADSMQIYKGLDVITNKITKDEMGGVEHWGLDLVQPGSGSSWELGRWCNEAQKKIDTLPESTLPILCGGTHYFIQHFLFPPPDISFERSDSPDDVKGKGKAAVKRLENRWAPPHPRPSVSGLSLQQEQLLDTFWTVHPTWAGCDAEVPDRLGGPSSQEEGSSSMASREMTDDQLLQLHRLLVAVDPREAGRWHWRDGRKVRRSLERWWDRSGSDANEASEPDRTGANDENGGSKANGRIARFRTLVFWVYEPFETLRPRLDGRVDTMVKNGLLREIAELRQIATEVFGNGPTDYTEGIFQSIGFKEFAALPLADNSDLDGSTHPLFKGMLDRMKLSTHQYAKSQLKWIRNQSLPALREAKVRGGEVYLYVVPGGSRNEAIATEVLRAFLDHGQVPDARRVGHADAAEVLQTLYIDADGVVPDSIKRQDINARRECDICSTGDRPYSVLIKDWQTHLKSRIHKRNQSPAKLDKAAWVEAQRQAGQARKAERDALREAKGAAGSQDA